MSTFGALRQYKIYRDMSKRDQVINDADETSVALENEIRDVIADLTTMHPRDDEYKSAAESLKIICEAKEKHDKATTEREKVVLQIAEADKRNAKDNSEIIWTVVRIGAFVVITVGMLALERQTPMSMRWIRAADALITPKI